ncbi:MAG: right-handed parallel beta-helix repeat-containing protein [Bacteroidia bacterium]
MNKNILRYKAKLFAFLLLVITVGYRSVYAQTYYVSNSGNDSYTTTQAQNIATPWKTIQHACNNASPGTTIEIMAGTYIEQVVMPVSGSAGGGYITLTNYNGGNVIISGNATAATLLTISSQSYIIIDGLQFYNCIGNNSIGIFIDGVTSNIEITNNTIHHIYWNHSVAAIPNDTENAQPLIVYGDSITPVQNITIQGNIFYDNATGFSESCTLDGNVDGFTIISNTVHNNQNIGIDIAGNYGTSPDPATDHARNGYVKENTVWKCHSVYDSSAAGIYVDGGENVIVERNLSYNNDWGIEVGCENPGDTTSGIKVRDNILYRNGGGMQVGGYDGPINTGMVINSEITNNTFFADDTLETGDGELSLSYSQHCSFLNNIFYSTGDAIISSGWNNGNSIGFQFDYNRYFSIGSDSVNTTYSYGTFSFTGFSGYKSGSGFDVHSKFSNPGLTDTALPALNFHLLSTSTCINAGMPGFPVDTGERDFYGEIRIVGSIIDIGADEYQGPASLQAIDNLQDIKIYPIPATSTLTVELPETCPNTIIKMVDIFGGNIITVITGDRTTIIDISKLAAGIYCVLVNGTYCKKMVKE